MAEADWHIRDLLLFYVSKCRGELLSTSGDPMKAETMFDSVKRVREYMLLMSCMVGAITPAEIVALNKLDQIRLVAENESAQMLRIGEDMTMLRLWLKTALGAQWNVVDAVKLFKFGHVSNSSCFPEMTLDLLTSVNKPFVVPSEMPSNWESIQRSLHASIATQFFLAKSEFPYLHSRVSISFDESEGSVCLSAAGEFKVVGIYDNKRWTIIEAQIVTDSARECRQILQAVGATSVGEICVAALRMATAQKLMTMQKQATSFLADAQLSDWCSLYSLAKSQTGLGTGFTVSLFRSFPVHISFSMNPDNGDLLVDSAAWPECTLGWTHRMSFIDIVQHVESNVRAKLLKDLCLSNILVSINTCGSVVLQLPELNLTLVAQLNTDLLNWHIQALTFTSKLHQFIHTLDGWNLCASPDILVDQVELTSDFSENILNLQSGNTYSVSFVKDGEFRTYRFDIDFNKLAYMHALTIR